MYVNYYFKKGDHLPLCNSCVIFRELATENALNRYICDSKAGTKNLSF